MKSELTNNKERILLTVIRDLVSTMILGKRNEDWIWVDHCGDLKPQFLPDYVRKPKCGDLVLCQTDSISEWKVSFFVEEMEHGVYLLKEIGSDRLCRMGNESLCVYVPMNVSDLLVGWKRKVYEWASAKAFRERYNPKADYFIRCGGVEFIADDVIRIWVRPHVWHQQKTEDGQTLFAQPKFVDVTVSQKTRLKDIITALVDSGRFDDNFDYQASEPAEGMGGCLCSCRQKGIDQ